MSKIIEVENLSKQYRLGLVNSGTLKDDLTRWWYTMRGKEDPLLKFSELNDRASEGTSNYVWSLKDINFSVNQGDVLGIIGKNGAGKSTLLKILSKVTAPTQGVIKTKGRVASLLEVGTGFHPELTGLENIFLNGAILGMKKKEIKQKLDEIVDFSGVERYLNTPVKRYSSGMYVRLAFAVAAHLESEILIVDEVLAVGDAQFQKKCLGKMSSISEGEGRTVLFVSHNIQAVSNLCKTGLLLENGQLAANGPIEECVTKYIASSRQVNLEAASMDDRKSRTSGDAIFIKARGEKEGAECWSFDFDEDINLSFDIKFMKPMNGLLIYVAINHSFTSENISNFFVPVTEKEEKEGHVAKIEVKIPRQTLRSGQYSMYFALSSPDKKTFYDVLDNNVNLPFLNVEPSSADIHLNAGYISLPVSHIKRS